MVVVVSNLVFKEIRNKNEIFSVINECDYSFSDSIVKRKDFENLLDKIYNFALFLTIYVCDQLAGYVAFYANDKETKEAFISLIAIKTEFQKQNLGTELIKMCEKKSYKLGMNFVRLEVNDYNSNAINFYKKNGYFFDGRCSENSKFMKKSLLCE